MKHSNTEYFCISPIQIVFLTLTECSMNESLFTTNFILSMKEILVDVYCILNLPAFTLVISNETR